MSKALITEGYLTDIANAIRAKNGSADTYTPPQMAAAIAAIPTGSEVTIEALNVTQNGTYTAPSGKAYSPVTVNVAGGGDIFQPVVKTVYVGNLTTYTFSEAGYYAVLGAIDGWSNSTIGYTANGASVLSSDNKTDASGQYGSAATGVLLHAASGDSITVTGTNISRQVMIVIFLTDTISSLSEVMLDVKKDGQNTLTLEAVSKEYGFYIAGSTGDNNVAVTITSSNTQKWSETFTSPVRQHKCGAFSGSDGISCNVQGTSYSTNYAMLFEVG